MGDRHVVRQEGRRRGARAVRTPAAPRLYTLTQYQAEWLARARDTEGGVCVPITSGPEPGQLVEAGAATYREVEWTSDTWNLQGTGPCKGTDIYLVPTEHGLELLDARKRMKGDGNG